MLFGVLPLIVRGKETRNHLEIFLFDFIAYRDLFY